MTSITSYTSLKQNIQDYTKRTGGDILGKLDQFIDSAESDIWEVLRVRSMEARATASTSTSDRFVELPDGFIQMRQLQVTVDGVLYDLPFSPIGSMRIYDSTGVPSKFTVTSQIEFNRVSDQAYTLEMDYFKTPDALSSSNTSNSVLTNHPMVYLSACLAHAFKWTMQYDLSSHWEAQFDKFVARANRESRKGRIGPNPAIHQSHGMIV